MQNGFITVLRFRLIVRGVLSVVWSHTCGLERDICKNYTLMCGAVRNWSLVKYENTHKTFYFRVDLQWIFFLTNFGYGTDGLVRAGTSFLPRKFALI